MTSLLGRRQVSYNSFQRAQIFCDKYIYYSDFTTSKTKITDTNYEITKDVLSEENRQRCMDKICQIPAVAIGKKQVKSESKRFAAILIALCTDEKMHNLSLLYTRRSHLLRRHMRQISFPGGIKEENEDFVQCALRETQEEIGLPPDRFEIWGSGNLIRPPHTAAIMPVIGVVKNFKESELVINTAEVEEAFTIPIQRLASPQTLRYTQFKSGYSAPVFVVDDKRIWGITGFITNIFLNCFLPPELNKLQNRVKCIRQFKSKSFL